MLKFLYDWHIPPNPYREAWVTRILIWSCLVLPCLLYVSLVACAWLVPSRRAYFLWLLLAFFVVMQLLNGAFYYGTKRIMKTYDDIERSLKGEQ